MRIHPASRKHGVRDEDALQAATWPLWIEPLDEDTGEFTKELRLGFDTQGRLLETVVLTAEDGDELLIHAMPARRKYIELLP